MRVATLYLFLHNMRLCLILPLPQFMLLPRAHAQGVKQSVCMSVVVVVVVVVVVRTKLASLGVLGP